MIPNIPDHPIQSPDDLAFYTMTLGEYHASIDGTIERVFDEGYAAAKNGLELLECPYKDEAPDYLVEAWHEGYDAWLEEQVEKQNEN